MAQDLSLKSLEVTYPLSAKPDDEVPIEELERRLEAMKRFHYWNVETDCRRFAKTMTLWREKQLYSHFSETWEQFISDHVRKPLDWVNHVIHGVSLLNSNTPVTAQDAINAIRQQQAIQLSDATPNPTKGRPAKIDPAQVHQLRDEGLTQKQIADELGCERSSVTKALKKDVKLYYHGNIISHNTNDLPPKQGNTSEYLAARLARDNPDILERVKAGEFPSMRAAAVAAGIVRARQSFSMTASTTPEAFGNTLLQKLDPEFALRLAEHIVQQLNK